MWRLQRESYKGISIPPSVPITFLVRLCVNLDPRLFNGPGTKSWSISMWKQETCLQRSMLTKPRGDVLWRQFLSDPTMTPAGWRQHTSTHLQLTRLRGALRLQASALPLNCARNINSKCLFPVRWHAQKYISSRSVLWRVTSTKNRKMVY